MENGNIKILIEKYFEGLTSLDEEQELRDYFRRESVPQELEMYKPLFRYFVSERENNAVIARTQSEAIQKEEWIASPQTARNDVHKASIFLRWGSIAAAACLLLFIGIRLFLTTGGTLPETSQAYIDGKKYTDIELIRTEALKSLENISEGSEDAYSSQIEALEIFTN